MKKMDENESLLGAARKRGEQHETGKQVVSQMEESLRETINTQAAAEIQRIKKAFIENDVPKIFFPLIKECVGLICEQQNIEKLEKRQRVLLYNPNDITREQLARASVQNIDYSKDLIPCVDVLLEGSTNEHRGIALVFQFKSQTLTCFGGDFVHQYPYDSVPKISIVFRSDKQSTLEFTEAVAQELDKQAYICNYSDSIFEYRHIFSPMQFDKHNRLLLTGGKYQRNSFGSRDYSIFGEKRTSYFE